jgi:hypothetical protein
MKQQPVNVGCDIIDCCPSCPAAPPIDLRVRVSGDIVDHVSMLTEGMDKPELSLVTIEGAGRTTDERTFEFRAGDSIINNISDQSGQRNLQLHPTIHIVDETQVSQLAQYAKADIPSGNEIYSPILIEIEQLVAGKVIARNHARYDVIQCTDFEVVTTDMIRLDANTGADLAAIISTGERTSDGCVYYRAHRVKNTSGVGNYLTPNAACPPEIAVFSDDDAIELMSADSWTAWAKWSGTPWDLQPASLAQDRWALPVRIWIAESDATKRAALNTRAKAEIDLADLYFNQNHVGISTASSTLLQDLTATADINAVTNNATSIWNTCSSAALNQIKSRTHMFDPKAVNVYYLDDPVISGVHCRATGTEFSLKVILMGSGGYPESLAHEIGHALNMRHVNNKDYNNDAVNDFANSNIMWGGGSGRTVLSEGQGFRMTFDKHSFLNSEGIRTGGPMERDCPRSLISASCPWVGLDITPN